MKKVFLFLLIGMFVINFASAFDWDDSIISYYKLDNTTGVVYDMLGINDGTNNGATRGIPGKINNSFDFDGINDYVSLGSGISQSFTEISLQAWIKMNTNSANTIILERGTFTTGEFGFATGGGGDVARFQAAELTTNNFVDSDPIDDNQWHHVVGVYNTTHLNIYIDGALNNSVPSSGTISSYNIATTIGSRQGSSAFSDVNLDEIGIWNKTLTSDEVFELYNFGDGLPYGTSLFAPTVTLESPLNGTTISDIGTNFTVSGNDLTDISGTWENVTYNIWDSNSTLLNSTTVILSGEIFNNTQFIDNFTFETYMWNAEACYTNVTGAYCVSAGNNNTLYVSLFTVINETFVNDTVSGTLENFSISIDILEGYDLTGAEFMYNGSTNSPSIIAEENNRFLLISDYQIPILPTDQNISFYWDMTFTGDVSLNSTERTQLVRSVLLDNCSTYTYKLFNISLFDEKERTPLVGDIEIIYYLLNKPAYQQINAFNYSVSGVQTTEVCSGLNLSNESMAYSAEIRYESSGYVPELYHIQRADLVDNPERLNLYDLNESQSTEFKVTYQDDNFNFVEGAILQLQRKYISEDTYEIVEAPLTSRDGVAVVHADLDSNKYKATIVKNGEVLDVFDNIVFKCESELTGECELKLLGLVSPQNSIPISTLNDFAYSLAVVNNTLTVTFAVPSGSPSSINVVLEHRDMFGNNSVCNKTVTSSAGSIQCTYEDVIGDSYLDLRIYKNGFPQAIKSYYISEDSGLDFLSNNFIILLIMGSSLVGMAFSSPTWIIINSVITMVLGGAFWLLNGMSFVIGFGGIMWLMVTAAILIFKIAKQEDR